NGNSTFAEVGSSAGVDDAGNGYGATWGDYDNDGDPDLYVTNNGANLLYRNEGNGTFAEVGSSAGVADAGYGTGAAWADYDNDLDLDLYVVNYGSANLLYRNNGNGTFTEVGANAGVADVGNGYGVAWGDADNDGYLDLYVVNYGSANRLYRNHGNGTFSDLGAAAGVADPANGVGVAWADFDGDSDLDLYVVNQGANRLYRNHGNSNRWLQVRLNGTNSNRNGVGARVTAVAGGLSQRREVDGGGGFLSQGSLPLEFGFAGTTTLNQLTVAWSSGVVQTLSNVATNQILNLNEPSFAESVPAAGLSGAGNVAPGGEVLLFRIGLTGNGATALQSVGLTLSDLGTPTGLVAADFSELRLYRSLDAALGTGDTQIGSQASIAIGTPTLVTPTSAEVPPDGALRYYLVSAVMRGNAVDRHAFRVGFAAGGVTTSIGGMGSAVSASDANSIRVEVAASRLVFTALPAGSVSGQALATQPVLQAQDAQGNLDVDFAEVVTLVEGSPGSLANQTVTALGGVAVFTGLAYTATADKQSFVLTADDQSGVGSDLPPVSAPALVSEVVATQLVFAKLPAGSVSGQALATQPVVQARDANGVVDVDFGEVVTIVEGSPGSLLNQTAIALGGVAVFTGLAYTATADKQSFVLTADDQSGVGSDLPPVSAPALLSEVAATHLVFTVQPGTAVHGRVLGTQPVVEVRDLTGQQAFGYSGVITLTLGGGGSLTGPVSVAAANGIATFNGLGVSGTGTRTLTATANGLAPATSAVFAVAPAPASISFTSLTAAFDGQPKRVGVVTTPPGLPVGVSYNGSGAAPVGPGTYATVATIADPNYAGSASADFVIHAPPVARLNASPVQGNPPLEVSFTDGSSGIIDAWYLESFDAAGRVSENRGQGLRAVYDKPGTYTALLTVRGPGGQSSARVGITVFRPPQVGSINPPTALEDAPLELNLAGVDTEPGSWSVRGTDPALVAKTEVLGDLLRFTPLANAFGADEVEIVRTGASGLAVAKPVVLRWLAQDDPPQILATLPTAFQAAEDQPLRAGGPAFAFDADTDPAGLIWSASGFDTRLVASAVAGNGGVNLVPVPNANGQTKATLTLRDPATGISVNREVNLTWTPVPDPPQAPLALFPPGNATGVPLSPVLSWSAKDADGEALRYTVSLAAAGQAPVGAELGQSEWSPPPLRPSTTYTWRVVARDPSGASAEGSFSFSTQADRQPPALSGLRVALTEESAALNWSSSEPARGTARALPEAGGDAVSARSEALTDQHALVLTGLKAATWYGVEVSATDEAGNTAAPLRGRFLTLAAADKQPPLILVAPFVEGLTDQSAVIRWTTDELATGQVRYAATAAPGGQVATTALVKDQQVRLEGLQPATQYTFEAQATDASGNLSPARSGSFPTARAPDLAPPRFVEGPGVQSVSDKEALVVLRTDELSRAELRYDKDTDLRDGRLETSRSGTSHQFGLSSLEPATQYFYQVSITDESGNQTASAQRSFLTRSAPDLRPAQILEGPAIEGLSDKGGVLVLRADEPVVLQLLLSIQPDLSGPSLIENSQLQQRHSLTFSNLAADTPYYYQVQATDAAGNPTPPLRGQFRTARLADTQPPRFVEGPFVEGFDAETASLAWRTDELATASVLVQDEAGAETARQVNLSVPAGEQRVQLTQLTPDTRYRAALSVRDAQGNAVAAQLSFKTRKAADALPPRLVSGPAVQGLSAAGAAITLGYDEPAEVVLTFADNAALQGAEVLSSGERRREHWIELRGLSAGTTYHGRAEASDAAGNLAPARTFSFTTLAAQDLAPPVFIAGPAALAVTQEGVRIEWALDEPASGEVEIGVGEGLAGARQIGVLERRQRQGVEVTGLEPNTQYGYRVRALDAEGNESRSPLRSFRTLGAQLLSPPVFTAGPAVPQVSQDQATLFWRTDQPADTQVEYFLATAPDEVFSESRGRLENDHQVVLTNLAAGVEYGYRVTSRNPQGTASPTRSGTFRTRAVADERPPVLLGVPSVLSVQQDRARVAWRTDELADSQVRFGEANGAETQVGDPAATVDHLLDLTNLKPGTTYHFQVASTDQAGNGPVFGAVETFTTPAGADIAPPEYTRWPAVKTRTASALLLSWATSELSTATLDYGKTPQFELGSLSQLEPAVEHEWHLGQLEAGQTYHLRIGSVDQAGNGPVYAPELVVNTLSGADLIPPAILTGPIVVQTTATSAVIEWSTDESTDGEVAFASEAGADVAVDPEFRRDHQLVLTNLTPGQRYEYTVASRDVAGNGPTRSGAGHFTTDPAGQTPAPQITAGPLALEVGPNAATVVWTTDVPTNTVLEYGLTGQYGNRVERGDLSQEHTVSLVGLAPGTTYHFKATSADLGGGMVSTDPAGNTL
ncbi:MAG: VCBS repeat-containing protein, partial [Candidatus Latescibacteria bacterium]|nr:VCBS repeat-containing protein [Candidatus Latescibacterota bacterium]